jgi:hypothetical protein
MEYLDLENHPTADPFAVLGSTLCLMSCTMASGCTLYLPRIAENLDWLAARQGLDADFRRLCRRLAEHWDAATTNAPLTCAAPQLQAHLH